MLRSVQERLARAEEAALARSDREGRISHVRVQRLKAELAALELQSAHAGVRNAQLRHAPLAAPTKVRSDERDALDRARAEYVAHVEDAYPRWREELLRARAAALSARRAQASEVFALELSASVRRADAERYADEQKQLAELDARTRASVRAAFDAQAAGQAEAYATALHGASAEWASRSAAVLGQQLQIGMSAMRMDVALRALTAELPQRAEPGTDGARLGVPALAPLGPGAACDGAGARSDVQRSEAACATALLSAVNAIAAAAARTATASAADGARPLVPTAHEPLRQPPPAWLSVGATGAEACGDALPAGSAGVDQPSHCPRLALLAPGSPPQAAGSGHAHGDASAAMALEAGGSVHTGTRGDTARAAHVDTLLHAAQQPVAERAAGADFPCGAGAGDAVSFSALPVRGTPELSERTLAAVAGGAATGSERMPSDARAAPPRQDDPPPVSLAAATLLQSDRDSDPDDTARELAIVAALLARLNDPSMTDTELRAVWRVHSEGLRLSDPAEWAQVLAALGATNALALAVDLAARALRTAATGRRRGRGLLPQAFLYDELLMNDVSASLPLGTYASADASQLVAQLALHGLLLAESGWTTVEGVSRSLVPLLLPLDCRNASWAQRKAAQYLAARMAAAARESTPGSRRSAMEASAAATARSPTGTGVDGALVGSPWALSGVRPGALTLSDALGSPTAAGASAGGIGSRRLSAGSAGHTSNPIFKPDLSRRVSREALFLAALSPEASPMPSSVTSPEATLSFARLVARAGGSAGRGGADGRGGGGEPLALRGALSPGGRLQLGEAEAVGGESRVGPPIPATWHLASHSPRRGRPGPAENALVGTVSPGSSAPRSPRPAGARLGTSRPSSASPRADASRGWAGDVTPLSERRCSGQSDASISSALWPSAHEDETAAPVELGSAARATPHAQTVAMPKLAEGYEPHSRSASPQQRAARTDAPRPEVDGVSSSGAEEPNAAADAVAAFDDDDDDDDDDELAESGGTALWAASTAPALHSGRAEPSGGARVAGQAADGAAQHDADSTQDASKAGCSREAESVDWLGRRTDNMEADGRPNGVDAPSRSAALSVALGQRAWDLSDEDEDDVGLSAAAFVQQRRPSAARAEPAAAPTAVAASTASAVFDDDEFDF
ncbi:hypothetical protein KFE25_005699 [Diacronema lutheri]|uniref:Uncharacterized protein n=1 Tax=Diacronema lutheri TaxID=2081491 RepID=A0A8J6C984_DIALT|nr:hypothetical protein KFE25_005699 [Diacronema lutheri]